MYPTYVNTLAAPESEYQYVNTLAGLAGLAADTEEQQVAALEGLSSEELGARHRAQGRAHTGQYVQQRRPQQVGVQQMPLSNLVSAIPGAPARALRKVPLPLGSVAFTATSGTSLQFTARTQRPYKGTRLVFVPARTGASATGLLSLTEIKVGQDVQPAADGAMPLEAFGPQVWDADLDLTPLTPGIDIKITAAISAAPAGADRVDVGGVMFGYSVQS